MALTLRRHGGQCCGISHIHGFYGRFDVVKREFDRIMAQIKADETRTRGILVECVLTQAQRKTHGKTLEDAGFKIVTRFINVNSGATLNVYHYAKHRVGERKAKEPATKG